MEEPEVIRRLKQMQKDTDREKAISEANDLICDFLEYLLYYDISEEYKKVYNWYP